MHTTDLCLFKSMQVSMLYVHWWQWNVTVFWICLIYVNLIAREQENPVGFSGCLFCAKKNVKY